MVEHEFYKDYDEDKNPEHIKGITDVVTNYTYTNMLYPCIVFKKGFKLEKHKVNVILNMIKMNARGITKDISLYYYKKDGSMMKMGNIGGIQVMPLLDIVNRSSLEAYLDKDTELKDGLIYTLCSI